MIQIVSPIGTYNIGGILGQTEHFTMYECVLDGGRPGILKISKAKGLNGTLDREAYVLQTLREGAEKIERAREADEKSELGYMRFFPVLVENFVSDDWEGRRILVLDLSEVCDELSELSPIGRLASHERIRIDPKTSVWILGRLLKLLGFAHYLGINVRIDGDNVLVNRDRHHVVVFDWSSSIVSSVSISREAANEEISQSALLAINALGGDEESGTIPKDRDLSSDWYQDLLFSLFLCNEESASRAHERFYTTVLEHWESKFHPFTAYPIW